MSKRKKKKFRTHAPEQVSQVRSAEPARIVSQAVQSSPAPVRPVERKVDQATTAAYSAHAKEYRQVSSDLVKLFIVNGALLALTLIIYFVNRSNGFLDNLYQSIF